MKKLLLLTISLLLFSAASAQSIIPSMMTTNISGKLRNLTHYVASDRLTVFVFWRACCPNNLSMLTTLIDAIEDDGSVKFVLVSVDDPKSSSRVKPIVGSYGWVWDVVLDPSQEFARKVNVMSTPQWVVVNPEKEEVLRCKIVSSQTDVEIYLAKIKKLNQ